jgi:hypothetical protein
MEDGRSVQGGPDSAERGRFCESDRWQRMDTGTRLSDQEGYGLNERWKARYGLEGCDEIPRSDGCWLHGWEKKE